MDKVSNAPGHLGFFEAFSQNNIIYGIPIDNVFVRQPMYVIFIVYVFILAVLRYCVIFVY